MSLTPRPALSTFLPTDSTTVPAVEPALAMVVFRVRVMMLLLEEDMVLDEMVVGFLFCETRVAKEKLLYMQRQKEGIKDWV